MRVIKRIFKWIVISLTAQLILLSCFNFIYLPNRGKVTAAVYIPNGVPVKSRSINLPSGAGNIAVSYNGLYAAYKQNGDIIITDIVKKDRIKTIKPGNGIFGYFRWLPDRDMLIYSISGPDGKKGEVEISTYDVGSDLERSYPKITGLADGSTVADIVLSPLTNVVYSLIKTGENNAKIYKFNIMDDLSYIMKAGTDTILKETAYVDKLIYQMPGEKIFIRSGKSGKASRLSLEGDYVLLEVDGEDRVYVGELNEDGKVRAIRFGKTDVKAATWDTVEFEMPCERERIYISPDGGVYLDNPGEGSVKSVSDGTITGYKGRLINVLNDYAVSSDGNKLYLIAF